MLRGRLSEERFGQTYSLFVRTAVEAVHGYTLQHVGYGIEGSQMADLIRVEEGRGGVDRVEAITASELRELVLRALIEMDEGDDMCRSIAVARRAAKGNHRRALRRPP